MATATQIIMPDENTNQPSQNHPQKQANRDREQQERIPQRGTEQADEERGIGRKHSDEIGRKHDEKQGE